MTFEHWRPDRIETAGGGLVPLVAPFLPVLLTPVLIGIAVAAGVPGDAVGQVVAYAAYGGAGLLVLAGSVAALPAREVRALVPLERPGAREVGAAGLAFVAGLAVYQASVAVNAALGLSMSGMAYTLDSPATVALVVFGAVLAAPLFEEVLFRGLLLGDLLERGLGPWTAGAASVLAFAAIHVPNFGGGGAVFIALWAPLPTALRLVFDNLSGAWLMHATNNAFAYVVVAGVLA
jgi:membrane protease YdiL (CAAX protease family)